MFTTIETRLNIDKEQNDLINHMMVDLANFYHKAWKLYNNEQQSEKELYDYLIKQSLTSSQVLSIIKRVKTENSKIKELTIVQAKQQADKISNIQKFINTNQDKVDTNNILIANLKQESKINYTKLNRLIKSNGKLVFTLQQKNKKLVSLNKNLSIKEKRIKDNKFKLCFGSTQLFKKIINDNNKVNDLNKEIIEHNKSSKKQKPLIQVDKNSTSYQSWYLARANQIYCVGDKKCPQGNMEIQYYPESKTLKIRLTNRIAELRMREYCAENNIDYALFISKIKYSPVRMKCRFISIDNIEFNHRYLHVFNHAVSNKQPVTAKIMKRLTPTGDIGYYLQLSMEELNNLPQYKIDKEIKKVVIDNPKNNLAYQVYEQILNRKPIMGIDLNANGLAYSIVKVDGNQFKGLNNRNNKKINKVNEINKNKVSVNGFISWDLKYNSSNQNKNTVSETIDKFIHIALANNTKEIAIENLDFSDIKSNMNSGYTSTKDKRIKLHNKIISSFISSQFKEALIRKCFRNNIIVKLVNPAFSSVGGYTKYGIVNKTQVDVSASLWLARQGLYGIPYKVVENVIYIKKHQELVSLPYLINPKQSKTILNKTKWKDISLAIGKDRSFWYSKTISYIQSLSRVDQSDNSEIDKSLSEYLLTY